MSSEMQKEIDTFEQKNIWNRGRNSTHHQNN
jgi:hypothetical protein